MNCLCIVHVSWGVKLSLVWGGEVHKIEILLLISQLL